MSDVAEPTDESIDRELTQRISAYFAQDLPFLKRLRFEVVRGVVTVIGEVSSAYERQLIVHSVRRVPGVLDVVEKIAVESKEGDKVAKRRAPSGGVKVADAPSASKPVVRTSEKLAAAPRKSRVGRGLLIGAAALILSGVTALSAWLVVAYIVSRPLPVFPAHGRVMFGDEPADGATVVFHPSSAPAGAPRPHGECDKDGNFTLTTYQKDDGAPAGQYVVTIQWNKTAPGKKGEAKSVVPRNLGSPGRSSLQALVKPGTNYLPSFSIPR